MSKVLMINSIIRKVIMIVISATIFNGNANTEAMIVKEVFDGGEFFDDIYIATDVTNRPYVIISDDLEVADFIEFKSHGIVVTECEYVR